MIGDSKINKISITTEIICYLIYPYCQSYCKVSTKLYRKTRYCKKSNMVIRYWSLKTKNYRLTSQ